MTNEVIVAEYPGTGSEQSYFGIPIGSQVLDIGTLSAQMDGSTRLVRLQSKGTGFWYKQGDSAVSAAADTNDSHWLPADQAIDLTICPGFDYIDTAADA